MADSIRVNGNGYSWGSIIVKINGKKFYGIKEITYGDKRTRVKGYGLGEHHAPTERSRGKYETDPVKISGRKGTIQAIRDELAALSEDSISYGNVESEIQVQYREASGTMNVQIERCVIIEDASNHTETPDPLQDSLGLDCMLIRRNGLTLFDSSGEQP